MANEIPIVIVSHKRAGRVLTHKNIANCKICVPEAQADDYRKAHPELEVITHPDSVVGIVPKRQWINDHFENVFQIDDDINGMNRLWSEKGELPSKLTPEEAYARIQSNALTAMDMGSYLFGFNGSTHVATYQGISCFRFTSYMSAYALGYLNWSRSGLRFDERAPVGEDYWICGLNAYVNRVNFCDMRFGFNPQDSFLNPGGLSDQRNIEAEKATYCFLKQSFGSAIQRKKKTPLNTIRHPYMRNLVIPY